MAGPSSNGKSKKGRAKGRPRTKAIGGATQQELAWVFGVSVSTIRQWQHNGAPARGGDGFSLRAYYAWLKARREDGPPNPTVQLDRRIKTARAEREELNLARERKQLIDKDVATANQVRFARLVIGMFNRAGSELASRLAGKRPAAVKREVASYFDRLRREAAGE